MQRVASTSSKFAGVIQNLASHNEVIIAGGSCMGSSIAYHLALSNVPNVTVIERDNTYARASAMLSAGGVRQQFSLPENIRMSMYGAEFLKSIGDRLTLTNEESSPVDVQFHENGYLFLTGERSEHILRTNVACQHAQGANWIELMDRSALAAEFPWMNTEDLTAGAYGRANEGYFDPWSLVQALKKKNMEMGVRYVDGEVLSGRMSPASSASSSEYNVDSVLVRLAGTGEEVYMPTNKLVIANGAWSGRLVENLRNAAPVTALKPHAIHNLPVEPRKRCIFMVHCPNPIQDRSELPIDCDGSVPPKNTALVVDPSGCYFRAESSHEGKFIMGVSPEDAVDKTILPSEEDSAILSADDALFHEILWPTLAARVPAFESLKVLNSWAGFYDHNTVDQNAIIGPHSEFRNVIMCTGFSGHGLQMSPAAGRAVSELISSGHYTSIDLSRFGFERIVDKKPIFEDGIV